MLLKYAPFYHISVSSVRILQMNSGLPALYQKLRLQRVIASLSNA